MDHLLQLKNVSKTFGEVAALQHVNFEVGRMKSWACSAIMAPVNRPWSRSSPAIISRTRVAKSIGRAKGSNVSLSHWCVSMGIEVVYQERALADQQSLWRNIFMGRELSNRWGLLDIKGMTSWRHKN